jgi:hypothetical protein
MKKTIRIVLFLSLVVIRNCKPRENVRVNTNPLDIEKQTNTVESVDYLYLQEKNSISSTFSHHNADVSNYYLIKIDNIRIYNNISKETDFIEINNEEVMLIKIPESEDWLYIITRDSGNYGFVYVYDISKKSFYGDLEENSRSGNYYLSRLYKEYEIIRNNQNMNRH